MNPTSPPQRLSNLARTALARRARLGWIWAVFALTAAGPARPAGPIFVDRAEILGLDFVHFNGMSGELFFPEIAGSGGALFDFDGDGDLDIYLVQGSLLGAGKVLKDALFPPADGQPPRDRLFRNDLRPDGEPRFVDVTEKSGIRAAGYGMAVAAGDYDGDGRVDLYVANYGSNQLWRNNGDGTFSDRTATAGAGDPRWSVGAVWLDYDRDGLLDLYIVNYVDFRLDKNPTCYTGSSRRDYCGPSAFEPAPDRLLRNLGGGRFEDVSAAAGIASAAGPGLGAVAADFDGDGWSDLYVANDGAANFLWLNRGGKRFEDDALFAGVAVNREGKAEASMGVDAGDFDGDGDPDLFLTHLMGETNTLYLNQGGGLFEDRSIEIGLASGSLPFTAFGTGFFDYDNDGWLDLLTVGGAVRILADRVRAGDPYPLDQPNQLFHNLSGGAGRRFEEVTAAAGAVFALEEVSRGAAFGDVDNDGDTDVLLTNNSGRARLLINQIGNTSRWLGLRLVDGPGPRDQPGGDQLGTEVEIRRRGAASLHRRVGTGGSYASSNDPRLLIGLGGAGTVTEVRVRWPDGSRETFSPPPVDRYTTLRQGSGSGIPPAGAPRAGHDKAGGTAP